MESWQELLRKKSLASLDALVAKFGPEQFPDLERLRQAALNFEFRISPAMVDLIQTPGDPIWRQYVPDLQELDVRDVLPLLHPTTQGGRSRENLDARAGVGLPLSRSPHRDPRRDHVGRRSAAALRPPHRRAVPAPAR